MAQGSVFDQALDYSHRADPYPLYAELRKTPVARQEDGRYVVSTYREIVALLHDPRVSSIRPEEAAPPGVPPSFIRRDPPDHDRLRQQVMRHWGPPCAPVWCRSCPRPTNACSPRNAGAWRRRAVQTGTDDATVSAGAATDERPQRWSAV